MSHGAAGYTTAKHGVIGLMRYYATSLAEKNIRVNSVHPSGVATPMIINEPTMDFTTAHPEFVAVAEEPAAGDADRIGEHQRHNGVPVRAVRTLCHRHHVAGGRRPHRQVTAADEGIPTPTIESFGTMAAVRPLLA